MRPGERTAPGRPGAATAAGASDYCGRFAPSPTGELHLGSLLAAAGSYLAARSRAGRWLVRMEDLDRQRTVPGAAARILGTLEAVGLEWDGAVEYQSRRSDRYDAALEYLRRNGLVYPCTCSRASLARLALGSDGDPIYPGICRAGPAASTLAPAWRFNVGEPGRRTSFSDCLQGDFGQDVAATVGDFVVRRRDGFHAYQLAVVVDDAEQGVTEVVRGCDLLDNTPRQMLLQGALGLPTPAYCHLPLLTEPDGTKLAKRRRSVPLEASRAPQLVYEVLQLLRQSPPPGLRQAAPATQWSWAVANWSLAPLRGVAEARL